MADALIVDGARTPRGNGKPSGGLHELARGFLRANPDGPVAELALPVTADGERPRTLRPAPTQGQHTTEILAGLRCTGAEGKSRDAN
jgi:hypothetical protein